MSLTKRLNNVEDKMKSKYPPEIYTIKVERYRGETKEQAVKRYEEKYNISPGQYEYIFVYIPSDDQIREELNNEHR